MTGVFGEEVVAQTASSPKRHVVEMRDFAFQPSHIVVAPSDTVVWVNKDFVPHFVSLVDGKWQSDMLEENKSWKLLVKKAGFLTMAINIACMVFYSAFLGSYEEPGWRDIDMHLPHCGQTS